MNGMKATFLIALSVSIDVQYPKQDNVSDHRAAAIDLQAEKAARPAAPCATYCYHAVCLGGDLPDLIFCVSGLFVTRFKFHKPQIDHGCYGRNEKAYRPVVVEAGFR